MTDNKYRQEINFLARKYALDPPRIIVFDCLDSTNKKIWEFINNKEQLPIAVSALEQTSGRGQWGKTWYSQKGGLYLSVALACDLPLENSFRIVMSTAVGITRILRDYHLPVAIKWSNDLMLDRRKLGGIKIETKTHNNKIKYAVVGVGINWQNSVPSMGINLRSYYRDLLSDKSLQKIDSLEQLTAIVTVGILQGDRQYQQLGISYIEKQYQLLLNSIGQQVTVNNCSGIITGVTNTGKLKVRLQSSGAATEITLSPGEFSLGY